MAVIPCTGDADDMMIPVSDAVIIDADDTSDSDADAVAAYVKRLDFPVTAPGCRDHHRQPGSSVRVARKLGTDRLMLDTGPTDLLYQGERRLFV